MHVCVACLPACVAVCLDVCMRVSLSVIGHALYIASVCLCVWRHSLIYLPPSGCPRMDILILLPLVPSSVSPSTNTALCSVMVAVAFVSG